MGFQSFVWLFFIIVQLIINCAITKSVDSASFLPSFLSPLKYFLYLYNVLICQSPTRSEEAAWTECLGYTRLFHYITTDGYKRTVCDDLREQEIKGLWSRKSIWLHLNLILHVRTTEFVWILICWHIWIWNHMMIITSSKFVSVSAGREQGTNTIYNTYFSWKRHSLLRAFVLAVLNRWSVHADCETGVWRQNSIVLIL